MKKFNILLIVFAIFTVLNAFSKDFSLTKFDNGLTVVIKEIHDNPIVTIDTWIKTGSIDETDKNNGVAHFLEHMFFKGTELYPAGEFDRILEAKGAINNAATSKDFTHYHITIPSKDFDIALKMHSDMILHPLLPRKELEKERKVVLEEISKNADEPNTKLYKNMVSGFYKQHPYKREVIGKKNIIETITREEMLDFYEKNYSPANMITIIVGDVDTNRALQQVKTLFDVQSLPKQQVKNYKIDKPLTNQFKIQEKAKIENGYIMIGFRGVPAADKKDSAALDILATILGDGRTSRLYQNIKEQKQLAYSISAGNSSFKDDSILFVRANFLPENLEKLEKAIFEEIYKLANSPIDPAEIQKAKTIIERDTYYSRESISNITNEMGYIAVLTGDVNYYDEYLNDIKNVSAKKLEEVAKKYLDSNKASVSILLPENYTKNTAVQDDKTKYDAKLVKESKSTKKFQLQNGATLLVTNNKLNDIIAIQMYSKGGSLLEKKPGVGAILASSMLKGTKKYSMTELSQKLEENGIKLFAQNSADAFSISLKFSKNDTELALDILNEVINNAKLDPYELEKIKTEKIQSIRTARDNPSTLAFEEFRTAIFENTPYGYTGKILEQTIPSISRKEIVEFYNTVFYPQNTVISINGHVDEQKYINYFSKILGEKKDARIELGDFKSKFKPLTKDKTVKAEKDSQAAWVVLGWLTPGLQNQKDWATLQVIDSILGTGMSSRLFINLRDIQGLAYQVGSSYIANYNEGAMVLFIGTSPNSAKHSQQELLAAIENLKKEFVSDKELKDAKDKLIGNYIISQETNTEKASTTGWLEVTGRGFDFEDKFYELINAVSAADIIAAANKYFSTPNVLTIVAPKDTLKDF